jgi:DnaK suppressor protein
MANKKSPAKKVKRSKPAPKKKTVVKKAIKAQVKKVVKAPAKKAVKSLFGKPQLALIRKEILKEREQLLEQITSITGESAKSQKDAAGDLSGYTLHMADMATDMYNREFSLELAEGERERLYNLEEALKRIEEGSYGRCDSCNGAISKPRLKALPQAKCCIKCQEKQEKSGSR